jgi:hypothetical protein
MLAPPQAGAVEDDVRPARKLRSWDEVMSSRATVAPEQPTKRLRSWDEVRSAKPPVERLDDLRRRQAEEDILSSQAELDTYARLEGLSKEQVTPKYRQKLLDLERKKYGLSPNAVLRAPRTVDEVLAGAVREESIPFHGAWATAAKTWDVWRAAERAKDGRASAEDLERLADFQRDMANQARGTTWGGGTARIVTETVPFAGEFLASGGMASLVRKGVSSVARKAAARAVQKSLSRVAGARAATTLTRLGADTIARLPAFSPRIARDTVARMMPDYRFDRNDEGSLKAFVASPGQDFIAALRDATLDTTFEVLGEGSGGALRRGGRAVAKIASKVPGAETVTVPLGRARAALAGAWMADGGRSFRQFMRHLEKAGYHGILEEIGEERVSDVLRMTAAAAGAELEGGLPTFSELGQEAAAFAVPIVGGQAVTAGLGRLGRTPPPVRPGTEAPPAPVGQPVAIEPPPLVEPVHPGSLGPQGETGTLTPEQQQRTQEDLAESGRFGSRGGPRPPGEPPIIESQAPTVEAPPIPTPTQEIGRAVQEQKAEAVHEGLRAQPRQDAGKVPGQEDVGQVPQAPGQQEEARVGKRPWEMTKDEFVQAATLQKTGKDMRVRMPTGETVLSVGSRSKQKALSDARQVMVKQAVRAGKPVPLDVLADYPDLKPKAPKPRRPSRKGIKQAEQRVLDIHERLRGVISGEDVGESIAGEGEVEEFQRLNEPTSGFSFKDTKEGRSAARELRERLPKNLQMNVKVVRKSDPRWNSASGSDVMSEIGTDRMAERIIRFHDDGKKRTIDRTMEFARKNPGAFTPQELYDLQHYHAVSSSPEGSQLAKGKNPEVVPTGMLDVGEQFTVAGEPYSVTDVDQDGGTVRVEDGLTFDLPLGSELAIDEGSLKTPPEPAEVPPAAPGVPPAGLFGQKVTEPLTGEQTDFEFGANIKGEKVTESGVITKEGLLRPDIDKAAQKRMEAELKRTGQRTLTPPPPPVQNAPPEIAGELPPKSQGPVKPISNHEIIANMQRRFRVPIRTGKMRGPMAGKFKVRPEVVRRKSEFGGDLGVTTHEVAHKIDKGTQAVALAPSTVQSELSDLDYDQEQMRPDEGFAEFVRFFLTHDDAAIRAPRTYRWFTQTWMKKHPELADGLQKTKAEIDQYRAPGVEGARARLRAARSETGTAYPLEGRSERMGRLFRKVRQVADDRLVELEWAQNLIEEKRGTPLPPKQRFYDMARRLFGAVRSRAEQAYRYGVHSLVDDRKMSDGIVEAVRKIGPITEANVADLTDFMMARHGIETWGFVDKSGTARPKNPGFSLPDAQRVYDALRDRPGFVEAADAITEWNNALVRMYAEVGGLSEESAQAMIDTYPAYVPMFRVLEEYRSGKRRGGGLLDRSKAFFGMKGSPRQVVDVMVAMYTQAERVYAKATANVVRNALIDASRSVDGMGWLVEGPLPTPIKRQTVTLERIAQQLEDAGIDIEQADMDQVLEFFTPTEYVRDGTPMLARWKDGKQEWYEIDPDIYLSASGQNAITLPIWLETILKPAAKMTQAVKLGAVGLKASFGLYRNLVRDVPHSMIQTEGGSMLGALGRIMYGTYLNAKWTIGELRGKPEDQLQQFWKRWGGEFASYFGRDPKSSYRQVRQILQGAEGRSLWNVLSTPLDTIQSIVAIPEGGPRIGEMLEVMRQQGVTEEDIRQGRPVPLGKIVQAFMAGSENTIDFLRGGSLTMFLNKYAAFSQVAVQAPIQALRKSGVMRGDKKRMVRTFVRAGTLLTIPTLVYWWHVKDEDWYRELPAWRKFLAWNLRVGNTTISIPRPFEYGWLFSALPEMLVDAWYRKEPQTVADGFGQFLKTQVPHWTDFVPDAGLLPLELKMNYDLWRDQPIVDDRLRETRMPQDQFYQYNTLASRYIGQLIHKSPAAIDHAIRNATGGMGIDILRAFEPITKGSPEIMERVKRVLGFSSVGQTIGRGVSLDNFYGELGRLQQKKGSLKTAGSEDSAVTKALYRMEWTADILSEVRDVVRAMPNRQDQLREERYLTGLSRFGLGKEELPEFPNILTDDRLSEPLRNIRDQHLQRKAFAAAQNPASENVDTRINKQESIRRSREILDELDIDNRERRLLLTREYRRRGYKTDMIDDNGNLTSFGSALRRLYRRQMLKE